MSSKAAKKAARRRSRALAANENRKLGRPPRDAPRYPSGKINLTAEQREKDAMATAREARRRQYGIDLGVVTTPEAGYALGRLFLAGGLGDDKGAAALMLEAGNRMGLDYQRYFSLTGIPSPNPRAFDMNRVRGLGGECSAKEASAAANQMMLLEMTLGSVDTQGSPVMTLCKRLILKDEDANSWTPFMLRHLRRGLSALVAFYGLKSA